MIPNSWTTVLHGDESCDEEHKIICNIQKARSSMVSPDIIHSSSFADSDLKVPQIPIGGQGFRFWGWPEIRPTAIYQGLQPSIKSSPLSGADLESY
jgi:hypothetical protein